MITIALPKGRLGEKTEELMVSTRYLKTTLPDDSRKLIFEYGNLRILLVRAQDVATYVEMGAADIGVVGKDVLAEHQNDVMELLDLGFGYCKMVVAAKKGTKKEDLFASNFVRVASKYTNIAKRFFSHIMVQSEVIKLYGSVELAAVIGMTDCIVDIVETGGTLKDNGLEVVEEIFESTARLICNRGAYYQNLGEIQKFVTDLENALRIGKPDS